MRYRMMVSLPVVVLGIAVLVGSGRATALAQTPAKGNTTVSGIVFDKNPTTLKVKADGETEATAYAIDANNKKLQKELAGIFSVARVRLTYRQEGDTRQLATIEKTGTGGMGLVTGTVLATHEWWIELKPAKGPPEGYAATYPAEHWKKIVEAIKELKAGETITVQYFTDGERHRIAGMKRVPSK